MLAEFAVENLAPASPNEVHIAIRTDSSDGSGSKSDPFNGITAEKFDKVLREKIPIDSVIILGPGIFRTRGGRGNGYVVPQNIGWTPKSGWRIRGSGMFSTVMRFISDIPWENPDPGQRHKIIYSSLPLYGFEIRDLTIDCNLQNLPFDASSFTGTKFSVTAFDVGGDNVVIKRVRVINFGTRTPLEFDGSFKYPPPNRTYEGFPITLQGRTFPTPTSTEACFNCVVEECIAEQPYASPAREVTMLIRTGYEYLATAGQLHQFPMGSQFRNCYFNFDFVNPAPEPPTPIDAITYTGTAPNVVATIKTRFPHNVNSSAKDYVEFLGTTDPALIGSFEVLAPATDDATSRLLTCKIGQQPTNPAPKLLFKSAQPTMRASNLGPSTGTLARVTTASRHNRRVGNWVGITGASNDLYNGTFQVTAVDASGLWFDCDLLVAPPPAPTGDIWIDRRPNGFVRIVALSDPVLTNGAYYSNVTTFAPHYRRPGDWISMTGIWCGSPLSEINAFNNYVEITAVTSRLGFTVKLPSNLNTALPRSYTTEDAGFSTVYQAAYYNGGFGGGTLRNRIVSPHRGDYHDFYWERQCIFKKNYLYNTHLGVFMTFDNGGTYVEKGDPAPSSNYVNGTAAVANGIATVTISAAGYDYNFTAGIALRCFILDGAGNRTSEHADVEVSEIVANAPNFTFRFPAPVTPNFHGKSVSCSPWFQQELVWAEDNIIDLRATPAGGLSTLPNGIQVRGPYVIRTQTTNPYDVGSVEGLNNGGKYPWTLRDGIIRDNYVRKTGGAADPVSTLSRAITMDSAKNLIMESNIIWDLNQNPSTTVYQRAHLIDYADVSKAKAFNNQHPSGLLIQALNDPSWLNNNDYFLDEPEIIINDRLLDM